ncbi:MAG: cytochrome c-type biogenesis protein CcmH [Paracoccaceae bacterium]
MLYILRLRFIVYVFTIFLIPVFALSVEPNEILIDSNLEIRARIISKSLRCLVCRNENIDESNAELARDLRILVRERLLVGETDKEIINYVVGRYGEYVLLKPKFNLTNVLLWLCGPIMLIFGFFFAFLSFGKNKSNEDIVLSTEEEIKISELLKD